MRPNVRSFVAAVAEAMPLQGPVYEFGSFLVDGQEEVANLRPLFPGRTYVGCDLRPGPGVDLVQDMADLSLADGTAGTILCLDTLEHVFEASRAVEEMIRVLAPGGTMLISVPFDFRIHDYPSDYWRFTPACLSRLLAPLDAVVVGSQGAPSQPHTILAIASKAPVRPEFLGGMNRFMRAFQSRLDDEQASETLYRFVRRWVLGWWRSKGEWRKASLHEQARFYVELGRASASEGSEGRARVADRALGAIP
jgi:SAM-dependent methyltransferase